MSTDIQQIRSKIYKYCAYQDRCTHEVSQKLMDLGLASEQLEDMLIHLENEKFFDDARFAHSFVRAKFMYKNWGRNKIRYALKAKVIPEHLIEQALAAEISLDDYRNVVAKLVKKKSMQWHQLPLIKRKDKTSRFLLQKGFEWDEIMRGMRE